MSIANKEAPSYCEVVGGQTGQTVKAGGLDLSTNGGQYFERPAGCPSEPGEIQNPKPENPPAPYLCTDGGAIEKSAVLDLSSTGAELDATQREYRPGLLCCWCHRPILYPADFTCCDEDDGDYHYWCYGVMLKETK